MVGFLIAALASGCKEEPSASAKESGKPADSKASDIKVIHPEKRDVRREIERPGYNVLPFERTPLHAKIAGYVSKWNFDIGDAVRKDEVLAELYIPEMTVELKQKEAGVRQAGSEIKQAEAALLRAKAELDRSKSQYERMERVGQSGVLDKEQVDETRLGYEAARAAVVKAEADIEVARVRLQVAEADRDHVQTLLQYTQIKAPFDGIVTRRTINTGDFVQPPGAGKGDPLYVVDRIKPVRVFVDVAELDAVWVSEGDTVLLRAQALPGQLFKGTLTRTSRSMDRQNRNLRTEIDLPNADGKLLPGMYMTATVIVEHKNVWALPAAAIVTEGDQNFCYRMENGKPVRASIQVGLRGKDAVEILGIDSEPGQAVTGQESIVADSTAAHP
jgi:RND family efflux transporter MFP subunit